jgi:hypothetical protein
MCGISCIIALREHTKKWTRPSTFQTNLFPENDPKPISRSHQEWFRDWPESAKCSTERKEICSTLDASLDKIKHRGPDSRGRWISEDNRVGMLAIPSSNHCKRISNTFI